MPPNSDPLIIMCIVINVHGHFIVSMSIYCKTLTQFSLLQSLTGLINQIANNKEINLHFLCTQLGLLQSTIHIRHLCKVSWACNSAPVRDTIRHVFFFPEDSKLLPGRDPGKYLRNPPISKAHLMEIPSLSYLVSHDHNNYIITGNQNTRRHLTCCLKKT